MVRRGSRIEREHALIAGGLPRLGCAAWWVSLAAASLVLMGSSTALAAGGWSAPTLIDPTINATSATAVSCTSASFCAAVGWAHPYGSAAIYNGSTWSEPTRTDAENQLTSVSCASSSFCIAMEGAGGGLQIQRQHMEQNDRNRRGRSDLGVMRLLLVLLGSGRVGARRRLQRPRMDRDKRSGILGITVRFVPLGILLLGGGRSRGRVQLRAHLQR